MKLYRMVEAAKKEKVAPRTGAWIETPLLPGAILVPQSPPARGRGLKRSLAWSNVTRTAVAPRTGAWIETPQTMLHR